VGSAHGEAHHTPQEATRRDCLCLGFLKVPESVARRAPGKFEVFATHRCAQRTLPLINMHRRADVEAWKSSKAGKQADFAVTQRIPDVKTFLH
jgi:hypothetical protein